MSNKRPQTAVDNSSGPTFGRAAGSTIDKNLAQQARVLDKLSDEGFEEAVTEARANVAHRRARKRTESEREATIRGQPPNQLENERKTTLVRMQQAEIEVAGAKAKMRDA